jgi:hypothetical protein
MSVRRTLKITNEGEVRFYEDEAGGSDYVAIKAPSSPTTYSLKLPASAPAAPRLLTLNASGSLVSLADGTTGQALITDGAGGFSWATINAVGTFDLQFAYDHGKTINYPAATDAPIVLNVDIGAALNIVSADQILKADAGTILLGLTTPLNSDLTALGTPWWLSGSAAGAPHSVLLANGANATPAVEYAVKTRGVGTDANTAVVNNDSVYRFRAYGADGAAFQQMAEMTVEVDGAVSGGNVPSRMIFRIDDSGMQERLRINRSGLKVTPGSGTAIDITTSTGKGIFIAHHSDTNEGLRVDGDGDNTLFAVTQSGNATAAVIQNIMGVNQPCLQLHARGNAAALEIIQDDGEDAIDATGGDVRCQQVICSLSCSIAWQGAVRFSDSVSSGDPSPDYFDVLMLNASDEIEIGNVVKDYPVRIQTDTAPITLEAEGTVLLSASDTTGVNVGAFDFSVNGNTKVTAEGEVDCKMLSFESEAAKTISSGAITLSSGQGIVAVDTEGAAGTDDLDTIAIDSSVEGNPLIVLRSTDNARTVVVKDGTNLRLNGDMSLDNTTDRIVLIRSGTQWVELCRSNNA